MLCYIAHWHKLSPSPFPIGKRLKPFWCQEVTFTPLKGNHFWWQMYTTRLPLNEDGKGKKGKGKKKKTEQTRSLRGEWHNSSNSKQNLRRLLKSACEQGSDSVWITIFSSSKMMMMQVSASPGDGHCHLSSLIVHSGAYLASKYSFHLNFLLERAWQRTKLYRTLVFHGALNPSSHLI